MSNDWWSRKIGTQTAPQRVETTPPVTPPMRTAIRIPAPVTPQQAPAYQQEPQQAPTTMGEAIRVWKGGEAHRRETYTCPECGSNHFFSRSRGAINGAAPAPQCYTCGYNGKYIQGEQSSWV